MVNSATTMVEALNEYFKGQAELEGKCLVDYVQFDTQYEQVYSDTDISAAEAFIQPRGGTALIDAIGRGTDELGKKLKALPEALRPGKVLVVVVTDGYENSSRRYTASQVKDMVTKQQDVWKWEYVFLGANIDAVAVGDLYGFEAGKSLTFNIDDDVAVAATSQVLSAHTHTYRGGGNYTFSDDDRQKSMGQTVDSDETV